MRGKSSERAITALFLANAILSRAAWMVGLKAIAFSISWFNSSDPYWVHHVFDGHFPSSKKGLFKASPALTSIEGVGKIFSTCSSCDRERVQEERTPKEKMAIFL